MDKRTEEHLGFGKIREMWQSLAVTQRAREQIGQMAFFVSEAELRRNMQDTTNSRRMIESFGTPPISSMDEMGEILCLAEAGSCLTPYQLERVRAALVAVRRTKDHLKRGRASGNPLAFYEEDLDGLQELDDMISQQIRGGQVDDHASKELLWIRNELMRTEEKMRQKAEQIMRAHKACMADSFCTLRNGRLCVPVKKECRQKVAGSVLDKSATGNTLFVEPSAVAALYEEMELLRLDEENEVQRILYVLSARVGDARAVIEADIRLIEKLDLIFSKGKLSIDMDAAEPSINTERRIRMKNARHPLMDSAAAVPLQFAIGGDTKGIVITGPNTGGKTVSIKTVALNCLMAQCGLHVTCEEADICMNSQYLCDIGDGQDLSENLSTFSAHIRNVMGILQGIDQESLVIMDELGSGTDPTEGMGIAVAVLEELRKSGCLFLVTTHYPEVKGYAERTAGIVNARMTFDKETLHPLYQMVIGEAGESCAFYIAGKLGMPAHMLRTAAAAAYGEQAAGQYEKASAPEQPKVPGTRIRRVKKAKKQEDLGSRYQIGDSVMVYPDHKIGIVCEKIDEKGVLRVQLSDKKIWISHKRVKLHVPADRLYPEGYDFSIIFDTVEARKIRHEQERKWTDREIRTE